ncbi:ABC transporter ATP-binding protein/permease [Marinomonas sp. C2222]|uniref:ABC transporter ATP-binding protein/permease n=1 Tax=Marinomonas sargassi TaxID=2984494 RepID=A0ABT2YU62_9GAMM|nr:ABC transporter ATP-binding protein [Marinomonas sargassi]MCV2403429.1 ABC transporter ATP-binding protein/permease [Marinomonas sargassi]
MFGLFEKVTRGALGLIDPYTPADVAPSYSVWGYIKSNLQPLYKIMAVSLVLTVIAACIEVWLISYAGKLIDTLAQSTPQEMWQAHGGELILAAVAVLLIRPLSQCARLMVNDISISCNIANLYRWRAHQHLSKQSVGWFQEDLAGRTSVRLVDLGNHVSWIVCGMLNAVAFGLVYMLGLIVLMAQTDIRLALPLVLWVALYMGIMIRIIPRMVKAQRKFFSAKSALVGNVVDSFSNFDTLKLFSRREDISADHKVSLELTREKLFLSRQISLSMNTIVVLLEGLIMVGFIGYGVWLWMVGAGTIGLIGSAVALSLRITSLAEWVLNEVWRIFESVGNLQEALKTVAQPITIPEHTDAKELVVSGGQITLENLYHQYGTERGGLNGVSVALGAGQKVGLVGRSGAGKSTLVNLILRFYEAEKGTVFIDGQDIRTLDQDSLRGAIGMVSQQAALLNRSVYDNIALGKVGATRDEIIAAARKAKADDFIQQLKGGKGRTGYDAHVGERGVKLSGGQRQRIALARVFLKNAPILILDEATSALDSEVEAEIQETLEEVMQGKTVIAIAHRLSTIAQMDRILVLEEGLVVEDGTHDELVKQDTRYAGFWKRQSGGFIGADEDVLEDAV